MFCGKAALMMTTEDPNSTPWLLESGSKNPKSTIRAASLDQQLKLLLISEQNNIL
jgi:hypothetical protein